MLFGAVIDGAHGLLERNVLRIHTLDPRVVDGPLALAIDHVVVLAIPLQLERSGNEIVWMATGETLLHVDLLRGQGLAVGRVHPVPDVMRIVVNRHPHVALDYRPTDIAVERTLLMERHDKLVDPNEVLLLVLDVANAGIAKAVIGT